MIYDIIKIIAAIAMLCLMIWFYIIGEYSQATFSLVVLVWIYFDYKMQIKREKKKK